MYLVLAPVRKVTHAPAVRTANGSPYTHSDAATDSEDLENPRTLGGGLAADGG